ncbi:MAG: TonB-dependent receptor [Saprospiraceae bacterium]|uniref:TonB-dependent receptor n=1 Tax=Candidatus Brachybacter algidus TaxID=2982024 RepID=UPI001B3EDC8A|nr:TonB-dependent receptor [Candidatus Brachybacter algidus]MBP7305452.1 TonB-dependent receptor [Saprospiraceae bacterium]MBK6448219.1 TonB-dependent receptor [Candidatus Brachybacter algidus]MBK7603033.1 TonB-dependent receptor [Candidatus Brachybacter algidus]MBK9553362.1 TonB-dependent receptor [Candidatus Brachybacter algidus]MBP7539154.1 TonB-dependent receptor [Saprospiraceae bacterium]
MHKHIILFSFLLINIASYSQRTILRGNVYDKEDGNSIISASVSVIGTNLLDLTDNNGYFNLTDAPSGLQKLMITYVGYDTLIVDIDVKNLAVTYKKLYIETSTQLLDEVQITAGSIEKRTEVKAGVITISPKQIKQLPSIGGDADIAQYLPVLPGIVSTGDQGGQIYIRGGAPIQNKIMIDGMTIFNPFHSIGIFSVFETEAIKTIDVNSAGFNVEHGGRVSAVVDIKTKEGNKKRISGVVGVSPFNAKAVLEGPIVPLKEDKAFSASYLLSFKKSLLEKTSKTLYSYANEDGLPFAFTDYYGKLNFSLDNGSKIDLFGFNFNDDVNYTSTTKFKWVNSGGGINFVLNPAGSNYTLGAIANFTKYNIELNEFEQNPRTSELSNYFFGVNITNYKPKSELQFGIELAGNTTDLNYTNFLKNTIARKDNTTELSFFFKDKLLLGDLVIEPGVRLQYYASLGKFSPEPRIGMKYNATKTLRFKGAAGLYSQNVLSTVDDRDVVNLFSGFLSGPEESIYDYSKNEYVNNVLQKAWHVVFGVEYDVNQYLELNLEPYYKNFNALLNINRAKAKKTDPDYIVETGKAYGIDFTAKYSRGRYYLWGTYSYGNVTRDDGRQEYPTIYDRTHNVNLLGSVAFGKTKSLELSVRFNYGTGFPFTRAIGFFDQIPSTDLGTDFVSTNGQIGILYESKRNQGRLPDYMRIDVSAKKIFKFGKHSRLEINASISNVTDRDNIFYVNRISYERINQLPILPSAGLNFFF